MNSIVEYINIFEFIQHMQRKHMIPRIISIISMQLFNSMTLVKYENLMMS